MARTITSLRKNSLMPVLAVLSAFLLVAGQVFNCCRLNETFAESVSKAARAIGDLATHPEADLENKTAKAHPGCHGHPPSDETWGNAFLQDQAGSHLKAEETCLSESGFTLKALKPSGIFQTDFLIQAPANLQQNVVLRLPRIEKPRPQNKSSPPVYLLTLRILV